MAWSRVAERRRLLERGGTSCCWAYASNLKTTCDVTTGAGRATPSLGPHRAAKRCVNSCACTLLPHGPVCRPIGARTCTAADTHCVTTAHAILCYAQLGTWSNGACGVVAIKDARVGARESGITVPSTTRHAQESNSRRARPAFLPRHNARIALCVLAGTDLRRGACPDKISGPPGPNGHRHGATCTAHRSGRQQCAGLLGVCWRRASSIITKYAFVRHRDPTVRNPPALHDWTAHICSCGALLLPGE